MSADVVVAEVGRRVRGAEANRFGGIDYVSDTSLVRLTVEDDEASEVGIVVLGPAPARICIGTATLFGALATADVVIATIAAVQG